MKEEIEEMAKIIARRSKAFRNPNVAFMTTATKTAESLYNAGYHKQSEGEWIWTESGQEDYEQYWVCSCCHEKDYFEDKFCPNCGAKMKGGAE